MIEICNLRNKKPSNPWDFGIHRRTPIGNPYPLFDEKNRNSVCDKYEKWFYEVIHPKAFFDYLDQLSLAYKKYGKLRLFCWCAPKRCRGETIKTFILEEHQEEM